MMEGGDVDVLQDGAAQTAIFRFKLAVKRKAAIMEENALIIETSRILSQVLRFIAIVQLRNDPRQSSMSGNTVSMSFLMLQSVETLQNSV